MTLSSNRLVAIGIIITLLSTTIILIGVPYDTPSMNYPNRMLAEDGTVFTTDYAKLMAWNITSKQLIHHIKANSMIRGIDISSDRKLLVATHKGEIAVMNLSLKTLYNYSLPENITDAKWGPQGEIVAGSENGTIFITQGGNTTAYSTSDARILKMAISPDKKFLGVTYLKSEAAVFSLSNMSRVFVGPNSSVACSFSPDGNIAFAKTDEVFVYNMSSGELIFDRPTWQEPTYPIFLGWSPDGTKIFAAGYEEDVRGWNVSTGKVLFVLTPKHIRCAYFDESRIYIAGNYHVLIFDMNGDEIVYLPEDAEIPFLLPVSSITIAILIILVIIEDINRRKLWNEYDRDDKVIFAEKQISLQELALLFSLALYLSITLITYMLVKAWLFDFVLWYILSICGILLYFMVSSLLLKPLPIIIRNDRIGMQVNLYQILFRKRQRWASISEIKRVSPHYFYNERIKLVEESGLDFILMDGTVLSAIIRPANRFLTDIEDLKKYLAESFGSRWDRVFVDEPYIDMDKWEKIKHLADRKTGTNVIILMVKLLVPILGIDIFMVMFPELLFPVFEAGLFWPFLAGVIALIVILIVRTMKEQTDYRNAITIKAVMEMKKPEKRDIESDYSNKNKLNPDRYLHMSEEEWKKEIKIAQRFYRCIILTILVSVIYFGIILSKIGPENLFIFLISSVLFMAFIFYFQFVFYKIEQAMALIKKAVEYEIRTGKVIIPDDIEIPQFLSMSGIVSRKPINITPKERKIAEKMRNEGELWNIKLSILSIFLVFIPLLGLFAFDITRSFLAIYFGLMFLPIIILAIYVFKRQKILAKVKEAERIEKLIEERKSRKE